MQIKNYLVFIIFSTAVVIENSLTSVCAILNDSSVKCWAQNNYGNFGDGGTFSGNRGDYPGKNYIFTFVDLKLNCS